MILKEVLLDLVARGFVHWRGKEQVDPATLDMLQLFKKYFLLVGDDNHSTDSGTASKEIEINK